MTNGIRFGSALAVLILTAVAYLNRSSFDPDTLSAWINSLGWLGALVFVCIFALGTVAFLPGSLFALIGGALFGPLLGTALNLFGATLGATLSFMLARFAAAEWVRRKVGQRLQQIIDGVDRQGWRFVAFIRLVPVFPFNLSNYALGLTRIGLPAYVLTTLICMIPGAAAFTWLGFAGRSASQGEIAAIKFGLLGLGALAGVLLVSHWLKSRKSEPFQWIDVPSLKSRIDSGEPMTIVDVRGADEFDGPLGHIPQSLNIPLDRLLAVGLPADGTGKRDVILVCKTDKRSTMAAGHLREIGHRPPIFVLKQGMTSWRAAAKD